ncbi:MAG: ABC transporter permease [Desulfurococcales archaeon]|nr:ABC transporter permease [Desulfurococcales archaeon]
MSKLYPVMWKELKSMIRDLRTLLVIAVLPLLIMPLMGLSSLYLQQYQQGVVVIIDEDRSWALLGGHNVSSHGLISKVVAALKANNFIVRVVINPQELKGMYFDLKVVVPKGFVVNLTSLTRLAYVKIIRTVGSVKAYDADRIVQNELSSYSKYVSQIKTLYLADRSGLKVNVESILSPIKVIVGIVGPGGVAASPAEEFRTYLARIVAFSLIFVTTPSIAYITDSIIGEKERKTFEAVLATPLPRQALLLGKVLSTSLVGLMAGVSDAVGLILFFVLPSLAYGVNVLAYLTADLVVIHIVGVYVSILASLALVLPAMIRAGSYRSSQAVSLAIISIASIIFFICLYVDIPNLQASIKYPLYVLPYTHVVIMIRDIVLGAPIRALMHLGIALAESVALLALSVKMFSDERIIYLKT